MEVEKRRLFVGGLSKDITEDELKARFQKFGGIQSVEIKKKDDVNGYEQHCFAYVDFSGTDSDFKKMLSTYNKTRWKGKTLQIALAKESFLQRLKAERETPVIQKPVKKRKQTWPEKVAERQRENFEKAGVKNFLMRRAVPGTPVPGEKNYVVGKFGRVLPVVYIRRKDKKKVMKYDPSKYSHLVKSVTEKTESKETNVENLTWVLDEKKMFKNGKPAGERNSTYRKNPLSGLMRTETKSGAMSNLLQETSPESGISSDEDNLMNKITHRDRKRNHDNVANSLETDMNGWASTRSAGHSQDVTGYTSGSSDEDNLMAVLNSGRKRKRNENHPMKSLSGTVMNLSQSRTNSGDHFKSDEYKEELFSVEDQNTPTKERADKKEEKLKRKTISRDKIHAIDSATACNTQPHVEKSFQNVGFEMIVLDRSSPYKVLTDKAEEVMPKVKSTLKRGDVPEFKGLGFRQRKGHCSDEDDGDFVEQPHSRKNSRDVQCLIEDDDNATVQAKKKKKKYEIDINNKSTGQQLVLDRNAADTIVGKIVSQKQNQTDESSASLSSDSETHSSDSDNDEVHKGKVSAGIKESLPSNNHSKQSKKLTKSLDEKATTSAEEDQSLIDEGAFPESDGVDFEKKLRQFAASVIKASTKGITPEERAKISNEKRLQAVQNRKIESQKQRSMLKIAFSSLDSKDEKNQSKHVRFDSDSEDDASQDGVATKEGANMFFNQRTIQGPKKNSSLTLFDDDSDDEMDYNEDKRFEIKPQFTGEKGSKLLALQDRFGGDERFRFDARFMEDENDEDDDETQNEEDGSKAPDGDAQDEDLEKEKSQSLSVLASIIGRPLMTPKKDAEKTVFKDIPRFDPTSKDHQKFLKKTEPPTHDSSLDKEEKRVELPPPEVSKEKFFEIQGNLKSAFGEDTEDKKKNVFSFFGGDDEEEDTKNEDVTLNSTSSSSLSKLLASGSSKLPYDSSDTEDEDVDMEPQETATEHSPDASLELDNLGRNRHEELTGEAGNSPQKFFFGSNDPRLKTGPLQFYRAETTEVITEKWERMKSELHMESRKRHLKAVRDRKKRPFKRKKH